MEPAHDCLEHLAYREHTWTESHGLDVGPFERCFQSWWECCICGAKFTAEELEKA